jgi:5-hydroxyisourate hydrolase-like protein (transthyretin family)
VTGPDGETPLEGIRVGAWEWDGTAEFWQHVTSTYTGSDGGYVITGLTSGTYRVQFWDLSGDYLIEAYSNAVDLDFGQDVFVVDSETAGGIDAALALASKISGRVTRMDGTTALADIYVDAYVWNGAAWEYHAGTDTDADGNYELGGLAAGTYRVRFYDQTATYLTEIHEDVLWNWEWDGGRDVVLAAGESATGIDAALSMPSSAITGTVTSENGATPLVNLYVKAYRRAGAGWNFFTEDYTDAAGFYELSGLGAGTYRVVFQDFSEGHFSEVYDNVPGLDCGAGGADIAIAEDETVAGIDAMLSVVGAAPALAGVRWTVEEGFVIQFLGTEDMRYMLQEASSLTGAWTDVGTAVSALAGTNGLPREAGASQMYWRVRQVP